MSNALLILGAALLAFEAVLAVFFPSPVTIGFLVVVAIAFVVNFKAWRDQR